MRGAHSGSKLNRTLG